MDSMDSGPVLPFSYSNQHMSKAMQKCTSLHKFLYFSSLYSILPEMVPENGTKAFTELQAKFTVPLTPGSGRSAGYQAGMQLLALAVTLLFAIVGGALVGKSKVNNK